MTIYGDIKCDNVQWLKKVSRAFFVVIKPVLTQIQVNKQLKNLVSSDEYSEILDLFNF